MVQGGHLIVGSASRPVEPVRPVEPGRPIVFINPAIGGTNLSDDRKEG